MALRKINETQREMLGVSWQNPKQDFALALGRGLVLKTWPEMPRDGEIRC